MRITIINHGDIKEPVEAQVARIADQASEVIVPDDETDITHWWLLFADGVKTAYFGTPESFRCWQMEAPE